MLIIAIITNHYDVFVCRQQKDELLKSSTEELVLQRAAMEREMADLKSLLGECYAMLSYAMLCCPVLCYAILP